MKVKVLHLFDFGLVCFTVDTPTLRGGVDESILECTSIFIRQKIGGLGLHIETGDGDESVKMTYFGHYAYIEDDNEISISAR